MTISQANVSMLNDFPIELPGGKRKNIEFVTTLYDLFGPRYIWVEYTEDGTARSGLSQPLIDLIKKVKQCYEEIQTKLETGISQFSEEEFPAVSTFIDQEFSNAVSKSKIFNFLRDNSYVVSPFAQKASAYTDSSERERNIYMGLSLALDLLEQAEKPISDYKTELNETQGFFRIRAFFREVMGDVENPLCLYDLVQLYKDALLEKSIDRGLSFRNKLNDLNLAGNWFDPDKITFPTHLEDVTATNFKEYFIFCSIRDIEHHLGFSFINSSRERLLDEMYSNESINEKLRSDAIFYSWNREKLDRDAVPFEPGMTSRNHLIYTLQIFFFFKKKYGVTQEQSPLLFDMIYFRDRSFSLNRLDGFAERAEMVPIADLDPLFESAFRVTCRVVTAAISDGGYEQLDKRERERIFPLLLLTLRLHNRDQWQGLFDNLSKLPDIAWSLVDLIQFIDENQYYHLQENDVQALLAAFSVSVNRSPELTSKLFFAPPLGLTDTTHEVLETIQETLEEAIKLFSSKMSSSDLKKMAPFIKEYIFDGVSCATFLAYYEEFCKLLDEGDLHVGLYYDFLRLCNNLPPKNQNFRLLTKLAASEIHALSRESRFKQSQKFSLFLVFISQHYFGRANKLREAAAFINRVSSQFPFIHADIRYFIYRYIPALDPNRFHGIIESITQLEGILKRWAIGDELDQFLIRTEVWSPVEEVVTELSGKLAACSNNEDEAIKISGRLRNAFMLGFHAPWQCIQDLLNIVALNKKGIEFVNSHLKTHIGAIHYFSPSRGVYANWEFIHGTPHLFFSYIDFGKQISRGASISLNLKFSQLGKEQQKEACTVLNLLNSFAFKEELPTGEIAENIKELSFEKAVELFEAQSYFFKEDTPYFDPKITEAVWEFMLELKKTFRALRYYSIREREIPSELTASQYAAEGNSYPYRGKATLIPESYAALENNLACYQSELSSEMEENLRGLIMAQKSYERLNQSRRKTDIDLTITRDGIEAEVISLYVRVLTANEIEEVELSDEKENGQAHVDAGDVVPSLYVFFEDESGEVSAPLRYMLDGLDLNPDLWSQLIERHLLLFKGAFYRQLLPDSSSDLSAEY